MTKAQKQEQRVNARTAKLNRRIDRLNNAAKNLDPRAQRLKSDTEQALIMHKLSDSKDFRQRMR